VSDTGAPLETASWAVLPPVPPGAAVLWLGSVRDTEMAQLSLIFDQVSNFDARDLENSVEPWEKLAAPAASVDLIVVSGAPAEVQGWAPVARSREARGSLFRAIHARLKPGGHVFMAVENRWAISWGLALRTGRRSLLSSPRQCRALLAKTGFGAIRTWCAFPDWQDPRFLVECQQLVFDYFVRVLAPGPGRIERRVVRRALSALGALKYTARWYWILGRRDVIRG
jgi:hypothetical protein